MKLPRFINYIWASDPDPNSINVVPDVPNPNDVAAKPSLASYIKGFRLVSMMPEMAGGKPAYGQDVNGVLHDVTEIAQYSQAGNYYPYDADFQKSIEGYNKYAVVLNPEDGKLYQSLVDANLAPLSDDKSWGFFTDGKYLPLTGGNVTGSISINNSPVTTLKNFMHSIGEDEFDGGRAGWYALPGGLMIQWVKSEGTLRDRVRVNFPIPFQNRPLFIVGSDWDGYQTIGSASWDASGFTVRCSGDYAAMCFLAIGF